MYQSWQKRCCNLKYPGDDTVMVGEDRWHQKSSQRQWESSWAKRMKTPYKCLPTSSSWQRGVSASLWRWLRGDTATKAKGEGFLKGLRMEVTDLENRSGQIGQLSQSDDHHHFVQNVLALSCPLNRLIGSLNCGIYRAHTTPSTELTNTDNLQKVGIFVDCNKRMISFNPACIPSVTVSLLWESLFSILS